MDLAEWLERLTADANAATVLGSIHRVLTPAPHLRAAKAGRNHLNEASDIAKPYQIYVKQRSCTDVNFPYKRKC